jgi:hypothetical protein
VDLGWDYLKEIFLAFDFFKGFLPLRKLYILSQKFQAFVAHRKITNFKPDKNLKKETFSHF